MGAFAEALQKLFKAFDDAPVHVNQLGDSLADHGVKVGKMLDDVTSTDAAAVAHAVDLPGGKPDLDLPKIDDDALSADDLRAIGHYTGAGHRQLNEYLRSGDTGSYTQAELDGMAGDLSHALDNLPPHEGTTFRGTVLPDDILARTEPGGTYSDPGFMSSSTDLGQAEKFGGVMNGEVMFTIDGSSGRDVDALSTCQGEAEILFNQGTTFDVMSKHQDAHGVWQIHLKER